MISVAYICDRQQVCTGKDRELCGENCKHTCNPKHAKNQKTVSLVADLISTFDCVGDIKLMEKEKKIETLA